MSIFKHEELRHKDLTKSFKYMSRFFGEKYDKCDWVCLKNVSRCLMTSRDKKQMAEYIIAYVNNKYVQEK
jgi:hypothetical protein